jgi:hypothetical protein
MEMDFCVVFCANVEYMIVDKKTKIRFYLLALISMHIQNHLLYLPDIFHIHSFPGTMNVRASSASQVVRTTAIPAWAVLKVGNILQCKEKQKNI